MEQFRDHWRTFLIEYINRKEKDLFFDCIEEGENAGNWGQFNGLGDKRIRRAFVRKVCPMKMKRKGKEGSF